jgi:hypothetical protein
MRIAIKMSAIVLAIFLGWRCSDDVDVDPNELEPYEFPDILNFSDMPTRSGKSGY